MSDGSAIWSALILIFRIDARRRDGRAHIKRAQLALRVHDADTYAANPFFPSSIFHYLHPI